MEEEKKSAWKIADKRRFDMEGNERAGAAEARLTATQVSAAKAAEFPRPARVDHVQDVKQETAEGDTEINFSSFVISLATQALMQLGEIKPPNGVDIPVDKTGARQTIDILAMLQDRTRGNLVADEAKLIEEILHNLRISFVRIA